MPQLRTFANLWTLWDHPAAGPTEWSLAQKIGAIADAGFHGVMGEPRAGVGPLAHAHNLSYIAFQRLDAPDDFSAALSVCRDEGATAVQVHLGWHDTDSDAALAMAMRLMEASHACGVEAVIETHRDTCTETPEKTEMLCARFAAATGTRLPLLWDFSHHAVVKHLDPPFAPRLLGDEDHIRASRWFHLRPFNGHHAQLAVRSADGDPTPEAADWFAFTAALFRVLQTSDQPEVWICPEIGPRRGGYGLSSFPPSWTQATALRPDLLALWNAAGAPRDA
jgi:hypothetical protein